MTHWGNHLGMFSNFIAFYQGQKKNAPVAIKEAKGIYHTLLVLMEFAMIMQIFIIGIYWPFVHKSVMERNATLGTINDYWFMFTTIHLHTAPFVAVLINTVITKFHYNYAHYKYCIYIGIFYSVFNFAGTMHLGRPLYPFLTWTDHWTPIILIALMIIACSVYLGIGYLINSTKKGPQTSKEKHL